MAISTVDSIRYFHFHNSHHLSISASCLQNKHNNTILLRVKWDQNIHEALSESTMKGIIKSQRVAAIYYKAHPIKLPNTFH